jgi:hypothetical protein
MNWGAPFLAHFARSGDCELKLTRTLVTPTAAEAPLVSVGATVEERRFSAA